MNKLSRAGVVFVMLAAAASPAAAQNKEHLQMEAELRMLQEQNQQLSLAMQQFAEALKATNARIDATTEAMRKGFADQALAVKNMAGDVSTVAERARDNDKALRSLSDEVKALQSTVTAVAAALAQGAGAAPVDPNASVLTTGAGAPPSPAPAAQPNTLGLSPGRMLEQAKGDYYAGQYTLAITGFEQLIRSFGDTEAAAEAQYWIGESQYNLKHYPEAIDAYNQLLQKYPRSMNVPDAVYKRGLAQQLLGDSAAARASFEQVVKQYPQATAATLAQQKLNGMTQSSPARP